MSQYMKHKTENFVLFMPFSATLVNYTASCFVDKGLDWLLYFCYSFSIL